MPRNPKLKPNVHYHCEICGVLVSRYITPYDQKKNPPRYCSRQCAGIAHRGEGHPMWNGGRNITDQGYVEIFAPNHPLASNRGYVKEHRLVMERYLGRYLKPEEVVHHKNDNTQDNVIENLELFANNAEHKHHEDAERQRNHLGQYLPLA